MGDRRGRRAKSDLITDMNRRYWSTKIYFGRPIVAIEGEDDYTEILFIHSYPSTRVPLEFYWWTFWRAEDVSSSSSRVLLGWYEARD